MAYELFEHTAKTALVLSDDGNGGLLWGDKPISGSVNYATGEVRITSSSLKQAVAEPKYTNYQLTDGASAVPAYSGSTRIVDTQVIAPNSATVSTISSNQTRTVQQQIETGFNTFDVLQGVPQPHAPIFNSWVFEVNGKNIIERDGVLLQNFNPYTGTGDIVGSLDATGRVRINGSMSKQATVKVISGVYVAGDYEIQHFAGRTQTAPIRPQSFVVYADAGEETLTGQAQPDESVSGSISGSINSKTGFYELTTSKKVAPNSLRFNAVSQSTVPLDADILGINASRLPNDGKVPIFKRGDLIVISNAHHQNIGSAHSAWQTVKLDRQNLDRLCVKDDKGEPIDANLYTYDLEKGELTWNANLDLSAYTLPIHTVQWFEEENRVVDVDISGSLKLQFPLSRDYPIENTNVSSALLGGDLLVRASEPFSMQAFSGVWSDIATSNAILAKLNVTDYPIELSSRGAITERWLLKFTSATQFELYGERLGLVAQSDIYSELAPINPATQTPYFTLQSAAFGGGGFATQNCIRFNTYGTPLPVWVLRATQPSANKTQEKQTFALCLRGNTVK